MIISGGENIASSEVERAIFQLAQVSEAAVIGIAGRALGRGAGGRGGAEGGRQLDLPTLERHCRAHLAGFKVPKRLVIRDVAAAQPVRQGAQAHAAGDIAASNAVGHAVTAARHAATLIGFSALNPSYEDRASVRA